MNPTFIYRSLKGRCYGNRFLALIGENCHTLPSFCALAFNNRCEDRNKDERDNTADDPLRPTKFGELRSCNPRALQARLRRAGYTLVFATHF